MTSSEYILRQLSKTNKKNFENYVVTRIWHGLNRSDIKMICQQYVYLSGKYALTDIYFPQLSLHIEIDESFHEKQQVKDVSRELDIIQATDHKILRVKYSSSLNQINKAIDQTIEQILSLITQAEIQDKFKPWNIDEELNPAFYKQKGYFDVFEDTAFRTSLDACNCLGQNYKKIQAGFFKSKKYTGYRIWFPKFHENEQWNNFINDDETVITEFCKVPSKKQKHFDDSMTKQSLRITFPRVIDNLGFTLYKFKGIFKTDYQISSIDSGIVHRRVDTRFEL